MIFDKAAAGKRGGGREVLASLPAFFDDRNRFHPRMFKGGSSYVLDLARRHA